MNMTENNKTIGKHPQSQKSIRLCFNLMNSHLFIWPIIGAFILGVLLYFWGKSI
jgi:hypothetical protein